MGNHTATRARGRTSPSDPNAPITRTTGGVTVTYRNAQAVAANRALFGRTLSAHALAQVAGVYAPVGTHLSIRGSPAGNAAAGRHPWLYIEATGPGLVTSVLVDRTSTGPQPGIHITNQERTFDRALLGDQARALALREQVRAAGRLGVTLIAAKAYTNRDGTPLEKLVLPAMGYDGERADIEHEQAPYYEHGVQHWPAQFASAGSLSDLLRLPGGPAWWAENGLNPDLRFNPAPGSQSMRTLATYLKDHGLPAL